MSSKIELAQSIEEWDLNNTSRIGLFLVKSIAICCAVAEILTVVFFRMFL